MYKKVSLIIEKKPLTFLLSFGIILRALILLSYIGVSIFPDSGTYIELSKYLYDFNFDNYSGRRTPGFPFLIAISGGHLYLTIIIQQVIGLLNIFFIYDFTYHKTLNKTTSFWVTFITSSFLHFIFYEFAILTETLSLFLVILVFWIIQKNDLLHNKAHIKFYILLSIAMGFLYLTRPMFIYFPLVFVVFFIIKNYYTGLKKYFLKSIIVILFPIICFYSWCSVNEKNIGYFTTTYFFGLNLSQASTTFFHKAPDKDKLIRDIFVKHRDSIIKNSPNDLAMSVWFAYDELLEKTNLSEEDLCNELGIISKQLIKENPIPYAKQVFISWKDFWDTKSTFLINEENFRHKILKYSALGIWRFIQQYMLIVINILFILFSFKKLYQFVYSKFKHYDIDLLIVTIVLCGSLAQALVTYGDNSRFSFPYLPLIVYFALTNLISLKPFFLANAKNTST